MNKKFVTNSLLIAISIYFITSFIEFRNRQITPIPVPELTPVVSNQDMYLLNEKYNDLEEKVYKLQLSHEMAVFVNQDLDERLSIVEGRKR